MNEMNEMKDEKMKKQRVRKKVGTNYLSKT